MLATVLMNVDLPLAGAVGEHELVLVRDASAAVSDIALKECPQLRVRRYALEKRRPHRMWCAGRCDGACGLLGYAIFRIGRTSFPGLQIEGLPIDVNELVVGVPLLDRGGVAPVCLCHSLHRGDRLCGRDGRRRLAVSEFLRALPAALAREIECQMCGFLVPASAIPFEPHTLRSEIA